MWTAWMSILVLGCGLREPIALPESSGDLVIQDFPDDNPGVRYFDRFLTAFGVYVLVNEDVSDDDALHATHMLAQYLDNDEDGTPDNPAVLTAMTDAQAAMIMFETERALRRSGIFRGAALDELIAQDLYGEETNPPDEFDATLEEVLHLVTHAGYATAYPADYGEDGQTTLTAAMDVARGGHFEDVPKTYPSAAWYHYDDDTCTYDCMATEYLYWALTSMLGAQADRCAEIAHEWELCTAADVAGTDLAVTALLETGPVQVPRVLPDGHYGD